MATVTWLPEQAGGDDAFEGVFRLRPNLYEAWREFAGLFWEKRAVDPRLLELCRLRIAGMHGARFPLAVRRPEARAAGLREETIAELEAWRKSDAFGPTERACLGFSEQFVLDATGISDEQAAEVRRALGDAGMVAFVEALALFDGFARFCRILEVGGRP